MSETPNTSTSTPTTTLISKSTLQKSIAITWAGIAIATAILVYLPSGPARHPGPGILTILLFPCFIPTLVFIANSSQRRFVGLQIALAVIFLATYVALDNKPLGPMLPVWTAPVAAVVLGLIGTLAATLFATNDVVAEGEGAAATETSEDVE